MNFLPDLYVRCEACEGLRYNPQTLECRFKGRSIGDVLRMRVDDARGPLREHPQGRPKPLEALREAGLGYVALGQSSTTLSGGEAQRVKLAAELGRGRHRPDPLHPRRAHHRPPLRRRRQPCSSSSTASPTWAIPWSSSSTTSTSSGPPTGSSTSVPAGVIAAGGKLVEGPPGSIAEVAESETGRWLSDEAHSMRNDVTSPRWEARP